MACSALGLERNQILLVEAIAVLDYSSGKVQDVCDFEAVYSREGGDRPELLDGKLVAVFE